jgi:plastocyanin
MDSRIIGVWVSVGLGAAALSSADVQGTIVIERKLTKRNVTATAGLYQRGVAVDLSADTGTDDPIDYDRCHVVVYLEAAPGLARSPGKIAPSASRAPLEHGVLDTSTNRVMKPEMEQHDRRFVPDLLVVPAGESISFPNFDPIFHNVFSLSKAKSFDLGNYPKGQTRWITFPSPGIVSVYCHLHPNMTASIVVTPNQWSTVADASGNFALRDVPPGTYTAVAWHRAAGFFRQTVVVTTEHGAQVHFAIPLSPEETDGSGHDFAPASASLPSR